MSDHIRYLKTIPLLPDDELLEQFEEAQRAAGAVSERAGDRASRRQIDRRLEALKAEVENRGIRGTAPWWTNQPSNG